MVILLFFLFTFDLAYADFNLTSEFPNYFIEEVNFSSSLEKNPHLCRDHHGQPIFSDQNKNLALVQSIS